MPKPKRCPKRTVYDGHRWRCDKPAGHESRLHSSKCVGPVTPLSGPIYALEATEVTIEWPDRKGRQK